MFLHIVTKNINSELSANHRGSIQYISLWVIPSNTQIFESLAHFSKLPSSDWIRTMPKIWGNKLEKGTKYPNIVFK